MIGRRKPGSDDPISPIGPKQRVFQHRPSVADRWPWRRSASSSGRHGPAAAYGQTVEWLDECLTHCAMYLAADTYGATNRYGTISLANATDRANVQWEGEAHTALADVQATIALVKTIAKAPELVHDEESSPSP